METYLALPVVEGLRKSENILLYGKIGEIKLDEENKIIEFLHQEYLTEQINYPYNPPSFDEAAALWASKTVYIIAQLLLYREQKGEELDMLLPSYTGSKDAGAIVSAALCLRFVPALLHKAQEIDSEDPLIPFLEEMLQKWHFSGIPVIQLSRK